MDQPTITTNESAFSRWKSEGSEDFYWPRDSSDPIQTPVHIAVPFPPEREDATAYRKWLTDHLFAQRGRDLSQPFQDNQRETDWAQAKETAYIKATTYRHPPLDSTNLLQPGG